MFIHYDSIFFRTKCLLTLRDVKIYIHIYNISDNLNGEVRYFNTFSNNSIIFSKYRWNSTQFISTGNRFIFNFLRLIYLIIFDWGLQVDY